MPGIDVRIQAGATKKDCSVKATGTVIHPITKKEIQSFNLSENNLKEGVGKIHGKNPDRAALNDSYSCGYLYNDFGWKQVQTVLEVKSAEVVEITSQPKILSEQAFTNNEKHTATCHANISQEYEQTTETNWSNTDTIEVSQSFNYSVKFMGTGVEGTTSMTYSHQFGQGGSESKASTVTSSQGIDIPLDPGESIVCRLSASQGVMKVRIVYAANVIGDVAVDYSKGYKDHHYWCFNIGQVREAIDNNDPKEFTEDIEIGFYVNAKVVLGDPDENKTDKEKKEEPEKKTETTDKVVKLRCNGHACDKCGKCHDWQFNGSQEKWDRIRNFSSWKDADWDGWYSENLSKGFVKRDGASCTDTADVGGTGGEGSARYLAYIFLVHICLCDSNSVGNSEQSNVQSKENPCQVQ